jgi:hypothetical protein
MNKKAVGILMSIFTIMAILLVGGLVSSVAYGLASSDTTFKINTAEDLRMMVNLLVSKQGDVLVKFPHDVSIFSMKLTDNSILIYKEGENKVNWIERSFSIPGFTASGSVNGESAVCLEKIGKRIILRGCLDEF